MLKKLIVACTCLLSLGAVTAANATYYVGTVKAIAVGVIVVATVTEVLPTIKGNIQSAQAKIQTHDGKIYLGIIANEPAAGNAMP